MTDLEMTKLCAEAMEIGGKWHEANGKLHIYEGKLHGDYGPLTDDAQAMALVKRFNIQLAKSLPTPKHEGGEFWFASIRGKDAMSTCLNRAIVECVAKMQANRPKGE